MMTGRYLIGRSRFVTVFHWQDDPAGLTVHVSQEGAGLAVFCGFNWAGCREIIILTLRKLVCSLVEGYVKVVRNFILFLFFFWGDASR